MPEKPPSLPEIEVIHQEELEREPTPAESIELYFNAAGFDTHPKLTPERRQALKAYILWNDGAWRHVNGRDILITNVDVQPDQITVKGEAFGQDFKDEIPV